MPHYADGTPAAVGDRVKGKGYNLKGPDGQLREFTGTVKAITSEGSACNVQVQPDGEQNVEYGQCDHFTKVQ